MKRKFFIFVFLSCWLLPLSAREISWEEAIRVVEATREPGPKLFPRCLTSYLLTIRENWEEIPVHLREKLRGLFQRPATPGGYFYKQGLPLKYVTPRFKFHYTLEGPDAVPPEDYRYPNGIPDFVEICAHAFEKSYYVLVEKLGYKPPLKDDILKDDGGDERYDVYLLSAGWGGVTVFDFTFTREPSGAQTSIPFFGINSKFAQWVGEAGLKGHLETVCCHEFFHGIQLAYNAEMPRWFMEACTTWSEVVVYDGKKDDIWNWQEDENNLFTSHYLDPETDEKEPIDLGNYIVPAGVKDLNQDGTLDLLVAGRTQIEFYFNSNGRLYEDSIFRRYFPPIPGGDFVLALAFIDQDRIYDLVVGNNEGKIRFFRGRIAYYLEGERVVHYPVFWPQERWGLLGEEERQFKVEGNYAAPGVGDINGDGRVELVVGKADGTLEWYEMEEWELSLYTIEKIKWQKMDSPPIEVRVSSSPQPILIDFDRDDDLDLFVYARGRELGYYRNEGDKTKPKFIKSKFSFPQLGEANGIAWMDFDRDLDFDLIVGLANGRLKVFKNYGLEIDPTETDGHNYLEWLLIPWFLNADRSLMTYDGLHEYGNFMWAKFLTEKMGLEVIKRLYENFSRGTYIRLVNFVEVFFSYGEPLGPLFKEFVLWNYFTGPHHYQLQVGTFQRHQDDYQVYPAYHYARGEEYPPRQIYPADKHQKYPCARYLSREEMPEPMASKYLRFLPPPAQNGDLILNFSTPPIPPEERLLFNIWGGAGYGVWVIKHHSQNPKQVEIKEVFLYNPSQQAQVIIKGFGQEVSQIDVIMANLSSYLEKGSFNYSAQIVPTGGFTASSPFAPVENISLRKDTRNGDIHITWQISSTEVEIKELLLLRKRFIHGQEGSLSNISLPSYLFSSARNDDYQASDVDGDGIQEPFLQIITTLPSHEDEFVDRTTFLDISLEDLEEERERAQQTGEEERYCYFYAVIPVLSEGNVSFWGWPGITITQYENPIYFPGGAIKPIDNNPPQLKSKEIDGKPEIKFTLQPEKGLCQVKFWILGESNLRSCRVRCLSPQQEEMEIKGKVIEVWGKDQLELLEYQGEIRLKEYGEYTFEILSIVDRAGNEIPARNEEGKRERIVTTFSYSGAQTGKLLLYPNPFLGWQHQTLTLVLPTPPTEEVEIKIYNLAGELVRLLSLPPGKQRITFKPVNRAEKELNSGIYFYSFTSNGKVYQGKFALVR